MEIVYNKTVIKKIAGDYIGGYFMLLEEVTDAVQGYRKMQNSTTTASEFVRMSGLFKFPIFVTIESALRETVEVKQNCFFAEGANALTTTVR